MDGSAAPFVYLILNEAGVKRLPAPRRYLKVLRPISLTHGRQAHRALSVGPLQGHLQHQLRPSAAPAPVADDADHRRDVRRGDRAGADVRVPEGSRDAAAARPRARRLARQRDRARRDRRAEQRAALRGRVRPPQDPRRRSAICRSSATRSSATWSRTAAATRCTRPSRRRSSKKRTPGGSSKRRPKPQCRS